MKPEVDYTLYLVTDRELMSTKTLDEAVAQAVQGGCTLVQLREKECTSLEFYQQALRVKAICDAAGVPLIINDRADIAQAVDAAGVHLGQSDLPCKVARRMLGPDKIVGVSAGTLPEALKAAADGADYLGVGAMYATATKQDADVTTMEELKAIRAAVDLPIVIIGGVNETTLPRFAHTGVDGAAVVSAIIAQKDIAAAARRLYPLAAALK
ncbi:MULTISPECIES: thiamine phosphate synthase [unclassified Clostridium]|uniref:thiamine phosphate synthase n=1 Tax=unclassified Clostridium TaxID=2614128 RepID=UPI0011072F5B|nr:MULTISPECIES: thiamine phosphate synthase [unclassified Clostridium]